MDTIDGYQALRVAIFECTVYGGMPIRNKLSPIVPDMGDNECEEKTHWQVVGIFMCLPLFTTFYSRYQNDSTCWVFLDLEHFTGEKWWKPALRFPKLPGHGAGAGPLQRYQKQRVQRPRTSPTPFLWLSHSFVIPWCFHVQRALGNNECRSASKVKYGEVQLGQFLNPASISKSFIHSCSYVTVMLIRWISMNPTRCSERVQANQDSWPTIVGWTSCWRVQSKAWVIRDISR